MLRLALDGRRAGATVRYARCTPIRDGEGCDDITVQTPLELTQHGLYDMYRAEQAILKVLPELASECDDPQVRAAYEMHEQQTCQQIQHLDHVFQLLGMDRLQNVTCHAVLGLKKEHDEFLAANPTRSVLPMFDLSAAAKTEHYEIASSRDLVEMARVMGAQQVVELLEQNLRQEQEMAQKVAQLAREIGKQQVQTTMHGMQSMQGQAEAQAHTQM
jgi:ferritin-like metal-binding protein YciE